MAGETAGLACYVDHIRTPQRCCPNVTNVTFKDVTPNRHPMQRSRAVHANSSLLSIAKQAFILGSSSPGTHVPSQKYEGSRL